MTSKLNLLEGTGWSTKVRPRFEGCNVGTWIGFKHVMYMAEEGIVQWFREQGLGPAHLLEDLALSLEITSIRLRLTSGTRIDDEVEVRLKPTTKPKDSKLSFKVELVRRDGDQDTKLASGKASAVVARATEFRENAASPPEELTPFIVDAIGGTDNKVIEAAPDLDQAAIEKLLVPEGDNAFVWKWRIPYFYCHNTYRLQHSGYARMMEEVVDLFLQDRGISIGKLLYDKKYNWIPVVSGAKIDLVGEARLEDTIYTVFTIEDIMREISYSARMDCYVHRDGKLIQTATGSIGHAYVQIEDRAVGTQLATFDDKVMAALSGKASS